MNHPFPHTCDNKRYHTWNYYLRGAFGVKVAKVALDAGFSCPNIDGTRGTGGCSYCSRGQDAPDPRSLGEQYAAGCLVQRRKWPEAAFIAYLQAGTNTHGDVDRLRQIYEPILSYPGLVGICIATRADALPPDVVDYLRRLRERTWLMVELGLQTAHDATARAVNRRHGYGEFLQARSRLEEAGVPVCVHLINGLPGETREMMLETARAVGSLAPHSVKLHMLHLVRGTGLARAYQASPFPLLTREEYVSLVCDQLELLPAATVIQRLTGDPPPGLLLAPRWTLNKRQTLNDIDKELARRGSYQGRRASPSASF